MFTGRDIINRARIKSQDPNAMRMDDATALLWLNDGQREIVTYVPTAYTRSATPTLQQGTRQTLLGLGLNAGIQVIDVPRNLFSDGSSGRAITLRRREWLDDHRPNWHMEQATQATHYMLDERDPGSFYLYPAVTSGKVEVVYSSTPPEMADLDDALSLPDIWANALQTYVLYADYSKDTTYGELPVKAQGWRQVFMQTIGVKDSRTVETTARAKAGSSDQ